MPRNKLTDLNNHLFEELEKLNDDDLTDEKLASEIKRAGAMANIAKTIVENTKLQVDITKMAYEIGNSNTVDTVEKAIKYIAHENG